MIIIRDLQTNKLFPFETFREFAAKSIGVLLFHHKYPIRPTDKTLSDSNSCTFFRSSRSRAVPANFLAYFLGRQTSPLILTAHKQYLDFIHQPKQQKSILLLSYLRSSALIRLHLRLKILIDFFPHRALHITNTVFCQISANFRYNS